MAIALFKIEYTPTGGGPAKVLLPGTPIPDDFPAADVDELTSWGSIGTVEQHEANLAVAEAERLASLAKAASDAADAQVRALTSGDAGGAVDGGAQ